MSRFARTGNARGWLTLFCPLLMLACSVDDEDAGPPRGPKDLKIARIDVAASIAEPLVSELQVDCRESLLVSVEPYDAKSSRLGDFALAQPGGCGTDLNCGWIVVTASESVPLDPEHPTSIDVYAVQSPIAVDLPVELRNGSVTFQLELRDSTGEPVLRDDGKTLRATAEVAISTSEACL